ncbi:MAG: FAD:protein FMN transferase [Microbacterium sp.]|uniref:FAD:protein FMN transferase n=1 Tax=Microbacterium sp. TaxID=51671 RepID=UPI0039E3C536
MSAVWAFEAIGTRWQIDTERELPGHVRSDVSALVDRFDREWSRFRPDSLVSMLGRDGGSIPAPADAGAMLEAYVELDAATAGAVNPLVGESLTRRGYDAAYTFVDRGAVPAPERWRRILSWDDERVSVSEPATIDVGALGKGRLVDLVLAVVRAQVPGDVVVDGSGDLAAVGAPVRVGLEHPYDARRAIGVVTLTDAALCGSAVNRRAWGEGLHHVLDARTGQPVRQIAATWALAPVAMTADAVATALFFDGGDRLARAWGVEWVRMTTDGRAEWSPGWDGELFL